MWSRIEAMPCAVALNGVQHDWLDLVKAVGRRDALTMVAD